jgi:acyl-[acyl-carrier protein] desaturase
VTARSIELYCSEELYVPDYASRSLEMLLENFGMSWFQNRWTFEESRHGLVLS